MTRGSIHMDEKTNSSAAVYEEMTLTAGLAAPVTGKLAQLTAKGRTYQLIYFW